MCLFGSVLSGTGYFAYRAFPTLPGNLWQILEELGEESTNIGFGAKIRYPLPGFPHFLSCSFSGKIDPNQGFGQNGCTNHAECFTARRGRGRYGRGRGCLRAAAGWLQEVPRVWGLVKREGMLLPHFFRNFDWVRTVVLHFAVQNEEPLLEEVKFGPRINMGFFWASGSALGSSLLILSGSVKEKNRPVSETHTYFRARWIEKK